MLIRGERGEAVGRGDAGSYVAASGIPVSARFRL